MSAARAGNIIGIGGRHAHRSVVHSQPFTHHKPMTIGSSWCCYEDSVLAHTDNDGRLSDFNCMKLCSEHSLLWSDAVKDLGDYANHGETLLGWLGY